MMMVVLLAVAQTLFQCVLLLLLTPLTAWMLEELPRWVNGEAVSGPVRHVRRAGLFWRAAFRQPLAPGMALVLAVSC